MPAGAVGGTPIARVADREATVAARQRFFGVENVDPRTGSVRRDRVILSWFGVTNFAMAIRGHVVLLDAWVPRGAYSGYVPTTPAEVAALRPEYVIVGHAHFDHAADAVPIAQASGATLVGTAEHCDDLSARAESGPPVECVAAIPRGAPPGTTSEVDLLPGVKITALEHLHSAVGLTDTSDGFHVPALPPPLLSPILEHPPTPEDLLGLLGHLPDAEGGAVLYRFRLGDMSLVWHDSAGPLRSDAPGVLDDLEAMAPVDVEVGAIQGFGQFTNGLRDPGDYIEALRPATLVPTHHDNWAPPITTQGDGYRSYLAAELALRSDAVAPDVRFISDPDDYVRPEPLTFPVEFRPLRLRVRCAAANRVRAVLRGDVADVRAVRFSARGGDAVELDRKPPFAARLDRGEPRTRVVARVRQRGERPRTVRAAAARC